jgi:hypothetical protein
MMGAVGLSKMYAKSLPLKEFEDAKGVIRIRKSKKNRQRNDQKKMKKGTLYDNCYSIYNRINQCY